MQTKSLSRTVTVELDAAVLEQMALLKEHGGFADDKEVLEAGIRALSQSFEQLENERRYREELSRHTLMKAHDLG